MLDLLAGLELIVSLLPIIAHLTNFDMALFLI